MDIISLYSDFGLDYRTEGHKHCRPGFVNVECPHCTGNPGYHLSFHIEDMYFVCWRCGWHPIVDTVAKLLSVNKHEAYHILKQYGTIVPKIKKAEVSLNKKPHRLPTNIIPLSNRHKNYLANERHFDPNKLEKEWNIVSAGPVSHLDKLDFSYRIIIPIFWNDRQVSFTSRDTHGFTDVKYLSCPEIREKIPHKSILYGKQKEWKEDMGILVEGPTDVWRLGKHAFGSFGIEYTPAQLRLIAKTFKRVAVVYDDDPQAIVQAKEIIADLRFRKVDAFWIPITGDPGAMKQSEADYLIKNLIR